MGSFSLDYLAYPACVHGYTCCIVFHGVAMTVSYLITPTTTCLVNRPFDGEGTPLLPVGLHQAVLRVHPFGWVGLLHCLRGR